MPLAARSANRLKTRRGTVIDRNARADVALPSLVDQVQFRPGKSHAVVKEGHAQSSSWRYILLPNVGKNSRSAIDLVRRRIISLSLVFVNKPELAVLEGLLAVALVEGLHLPKGEYEGGNK